jgi:hypothetical protein
MRLSERDKRDREEFEEWQALPLNERYAWGRIAITGIVIAAALFASTRPHAADDQIRPERLFDHASVR